MAIVPQHATATADVDGDAIFAFPDVPQGELWSGTTQISGAPSTTVGVVTGGGEYFGDMFGPGSYGPWTCGHSQKLVITATGLTPDVQYQAVWHADDKGQQYSTYPAPITPVAVGGGGTVDVGNFPATQTVDGTVGVTGGPITTKPDLAASAPAGTTSMTGTAVTLPSHVPIQGVVLSTPSANAHPVTIGGGFVMEPGQTTPLLPIANLDLLTATGTSPDVVSWLVT